MNTIEKCVACPHRCGVKRTLLEGNGFCGMGLQPKVARVGPHYWEEPCISGSRGSGAENSFFDGHRIDLLKINIRRNYINLHL